MQGGWIPDIIKVIGLQTYCGTAL